MILSTNLKARITFLLRSIDPLIEHSPFQPFDPLIIDFLNELSKNILKDSAAREYPDVVTFAYWCRKSNITRLKKEYGDQENRLGLGNAFHISPSNVPINFAFSLVFSLLAGNSNIVKVPSKNFPQIDTIIRLIKKSFADAKFNKIEQMTSIIKYHHEDEITRFFSANCDARIIWGGDNTISEIRKFPTPTRSIDVAFADRYSFSVIDADSILSLNNDDLTKLATSFYNDTYLMDQNACSSPHLIVWLGEKGQIDEAKKIFWNSVYVEVAKKYLSEPIGVIDKYTHLCKDAIELSNATDYTNYGNLIFIIQLNKIAQGISSLRGKFGYFYEYYTRDLNSIIQIVDKTFQTLTYFGIDKSILNNFVLNNSLPGIDRIVPIGSALDISVHWDGYDLIRTLSRMIVIK